MPGEPGQLPGPGPGVQPLGVAALAVLQRSVDEHFEERDPLVGVHLRAISRCSSSGLIAGTSTPGIGHQRGDIAHPAQVLGAVGHREPEVGVEAVTQVVAVENVCGTTTFEQLLLHQHRDRGFARTGQPGEPQCAALVRPRSLRPSPADWWRTVLGGGAATNGTETPRGHRHIGVGVDEDEDPVLALRRTRRAATAPGAQVNRPSSLSFNAVAPCRDAMC